jgi:hypothetical protein
VNLGVHERVKNDSEITRPMEKKFEEVFAQKIKNELHAEFWNKMIEVIV